MSERIELRLHEWQCQSIRLPGGFGDDAASRETAARLTQSGRLIVRELRDSIDVETSSYVGAIRLGPIDISVEPKLGRTHLASFFAYAYATTRIHDFPEMASLDFTSNGVRELIIRQFLAETRTLVARGLLQDYRAREERLSSPRGRILFEQLARGGGVTDSTLPCRHYLHSPDNGPNQALLAGARLVKSISTDQGHIIEANGIDQLLSSEVMIVPVGKVAREIGQHGNRRFIAYRAALRLLALLLASTGVDISGSGEPSIPGFLFDMNSLWEDVLERLLIENAPRSTHVEAQMKLRDVFKREDGSTPRVPRPDYAWMRGSTCLRLLDAKYRELRERGLTRDMLYQLAVYALSQPLGSEVVALYPSETTGASDESTFINDPVLGQRRGRIVTRPVDVARLAEVALAGGSKGRHQRARLASELLGSV